MTLTPEDLSKDQLLANLPRNDKGQPTLGGIPVLRRIGQGGMGAVYYAVHPRLQVEVAVKILPFHLVQQEPGMVARFESEARVAAGLSSDHIVRVLDVNQEQGTHYLVMEFVSGESAGGMLRRMKEEGRAGMTEMEALEIVKSATRGMAAAHERGIVHRDIKPDNILIPGGHRLKAKIADLGLAKPESGGTSLGTMSYVAMGTPGYMAPEQAEDAKRATAASDVFAMGATLYALLSGRAPFVGSSLMGVLRHTAEKDPDPLPASTGAGTRAIVEKCLAKDPAKRYVNGSELLKALEGVVPSNEMATAPTIIRPSEMVHKTLLTMPATPKPGQVDEQVRARRLLKIGCAIAVFLGFLAGGIGLAVYLLNLPDGENDLDVSDAEPGDSSVITLDDAGTIKMKFVLVPAGRFQMGDASVQWAPPHEETIVGSFWMATTEVTQEQWMALMGTNPSTTHGPALPVTNVSWDECQEFLGRLMSRVKKGTPGLPSEPEWEYACRAGTSTPWNFGSDPAVIQDFAWCQSNSQGRIQGVGGKRPNAWGLHDMHGNAWEWTYSEFVNPGQRVVRGGSCIISYPEYMKSASRRGVDRNQKYDDLGFRIVIR